MFSLPAYGCLLLENSYFLFNPIMPLAGSVELSEITRICVCATATNLYVDENG